MLNFKTWLENQEPIKSLQELNDIIPEIIQAAQQTYNAWTQNDDGIDEELGVGGICQDIAGEICGVLSNHGFDCTTVSQEIGEQHVYTIVKLDDGVYEIDIPPSVYETGGGYNWRKIPNVNFNKNHLIISKIDGDPESFDNYTGY